MPSQNTKQSILCHFQAARNHLERCNQKSRCLQLTCDELRKREVSQVPQMAKTANKRTNRPAERPCQWQKERAMLADNVRTLGEKGKHDHCDERARLCKKRSWTSRPCCKMKQIFVGSAAQNRCEQFQAAVFSVKHAVFRPCTTLIQNKLFRSQHAHLKQIQSIHLDPTKAAHSCCELCTD